MERALSAGISWEETDLITTICAICLKNLQEQSWLRGQCKVPRGRNCQRTTVAQAGSAGIPSGNCRQQNHNMVEDGFPEVKYRFQTSPASSSFLAHQEQSRPKVTSFSKGNLNRLGNSPGWGILLFPVCFFLTCWPSPKHTPCFHRTVS